MELQRKHVSVLGRLLTSVIVGCIVSLSLQVYALAYTDSDRRINIAAIFPLTGNGANASRSSVLGTRLAVDEINSGGGIIGRNVNLILLDNMSTPIGSSVAARQAVSAGVAGIIGAQWSSHSLAIAEVAQKNRVPMISNFSTHPKLTAIGDYIFRVCYTDEFQGKVMADFARTDLSARTAVVFVDLTSDYSLALSQIFKTKFTALGGNIVGEIEYKSRAGNYRKLLPQAMAVSADVMFLSGHEESGVIGRLLQESGVKSTLLGGDGWSDNAFWDMGGRYISHGYYCTHWSEESSTNEAKEFVRKYGQFEDFGTGAALAYDAVMVLKEAIEAAGSTDGTEVAKSLSNMESYTGVTGSIEFGTHGDPVKSAVIMKIEDGKPHFFKTLVPH